ncbi:MAG: hypothetical protein M1836_005165 [Candelina mexicana]|nr:MAG: hypothetical protein M1836_005165 [Candelina mexicana]
MEPAYGIENKAGGQGAIPMNDPYAQPAQQAQPPQYNQYNYPPPAGHPTEHQQQYTGGAPAPVQSPGPQYHQPSPQVQVQPIAHGTPTQQPSQGYFPDKGQHTPATTTVATPGPTQQPTSRYQTATPLHALSMGPAPVDCPACGKREVTRVTFENGNTTQ